ncbi:MAG: hypothetical protein JNM20_18600 [Rhizobiales bacterium]|nr:hypothetical protein [Hyphomicrobiales bacterium]
MILVGDPRFDWHDLEQIGYKLVRLAPDIAVQLVSRLDTSAALSDEKWARPSMTVSFGPLGNFEPRRGSVFMNRPISKLDQISMLKHAGINVPRAERFKFGQAYSEDEWGEFVVLKPLPLNLTSKGGTVQLIRTKNLKALTPDRFPDDHALSQGPAMIQQFIDTGEYATNWRVLTLFGEPLHSLKSRAAIARPALSATDEEIESAIVEPKHPKFKAEFKYQDYRSLESDPEILEFARLIHTAFPRTPLKGCDIVREAKTGRLFALEINAGGNTWHFSSEIFAKNRQLLGGKEAFVKQFDAWKTAAEVFIRQTRAHAC